MQFGDLLTDQSLDFSRRHLTAYYDTDFFPKPLEFESILFHWDELKALPRNQLAQTVPPIAMPWKKPRGGYRVVHQMDPLDVICYTAAAHAVARDVERARVPKYARVACSYRVSPDDQSFFYSGSGFSDYRERCESLAKSHRYVLATDISDFYNRIYLHRLENAVSGATGNAAGKAIEAFLMGINSKASQGIPVGPAASIVLSEAVLIDVNQFLANRSVEHVRYVDDIRVFATSSDRLDEVLQELTIYLHKNHRLGLVGDKTRIIESSKFVHEELTNQYQLEKLDILREIEVVNPYTFQADEIEVEIADDAGERLVDALKRILAFDYLDLAVARAIIRRARAHRIPDIAPLLLHHIAYFRPVVNDVVLYLEMISTDERLETIAPLLVRLEEERQLDNCSAAEWFAWYISRHKKLLAYRELRGVLSRVNRQRYSASAAVLTENIAWVREYKDQVLNLAGWDRRAIIYAAQILSPDEKTVWLKSLKSKPSLTLLDRWMIDWVLAGIPEAEPLPPPVSSPWDDYVDLDGIPF